MYWKSIFVGMLIGACGTVISVMIISRLSSKQLPLINPTNPTPIPKPLQQYSFSNLQHYIARPSQIKLERTMFTEAGLTAYLASYTTNTKRMSLQVMVPDSATPSAGFPTILMDRGFVDTALYQTGVGTKNVARYLAKHGFATIAPDFLGYGGSDSAPIDTIEARVERPRQLLDLLASFQTLAFVDTNRIGIWGHSNGGQVTLSLLEVSQKPYPTVLWAPVSKPFPYSVLYYTDDSDDQGKELRRVVANFEKTYDVFDFSIDKYFDNIAAPIEIHQGTADDSVPVAWSNALVKTLKSKQKDITYFVYSGNDHNLRPDWNTAMQRSLIFFQEHLAQR